MNAHPRLISESDQFELAQAFQRLDHPSYAIRLSSALGSPITATLKLLPVSLSLKIHRAARDIVSRGLDFSIDHLISKKSPGNPRVQRALCIASGALGGFFGGPALLLEMPFSTSLILSSIAEIARQEGEDLESIEARLACLSVFALGGCSSEDDDADVGYYGLRMALQSPVTEASKYLTASGLRGAGKSPALVNLINVISRRLGVVLSRRAMGMMIPMIGAAAGALCNRMFMDHFQDMARCHFAIRRLERKYSRDTVEAFYLESKRQRRIPSPYQLPTPTPALPRLAA
jgi:EcsC protein family